MLLRYFIITLAIAAFSSCNSDKQKAGVQQSTTPVAILSSDIENVDNHFDVFIEQFSRDTAFQLKRIKFPLRIKQYDIENDKDTIIYKSRSVFEMMDFRKKKSLSSLDQWKQEIILYKSQSKATIEIRGIENGIMVDYYFEKSDGKWMLVGIDDSST